MVRRGDVGRRPESPRKTTGEITEMDVGEMQLSLACGIEMEAHAFVCERLADMIAFSFVHQEATLGDALDFKSAGYTSGLSLSLSRRELGR